MAEFDKGGPGLGNAQVARRAGIQSHKIDFGYVSTSAFESALHLRTGETPLAGQQCYVEGTGRYTYSGSAWEADNAVAAGTTLQAAFNASVGKIVGSSVVDSGLEIEHGAGTSNGGFLLLLDNNDTTDNPTCLLIDQILSATGDALVVNYNTAEVLSIDVNGIIDPGGVFLPDNTLAMFGATQTTYDAKIYSDGTNLVIGARTDDGAPIHLGTSAVAQDVKWWDADSGYVQLDAGAANVEFEDVTITMMDDTAINLGDSGDFTIDCDGTDLDIDAGAANGIVKFGTDIDTDVWIATANGTFKWDASGDLLTLDAADILVGDDDILSFGNNSDFSITYDETTDDLLKIYPGTQGQTIQIGSGNTTTLTKAANLIWLSDTSGDYVQFDEENVNVKFEDVTITMMDDTAINLGDSSDVVLDWNTTGSAYLMMAAAADNTTWQIGTGTAGFNITLYGGDANTTITYDCDGGSGTTGLWTFGADDYGVDVRFNGATSGDYILFDESADDLIFEDIKLLLMDDTELAIGDSSDVTLDWKSAGGLYLECLADNSVWTIGSGTLSFDLKWYGGDTSTYLSFNADGGSGATGEFSFGVDDHGVDVYFRGATAGKYVFWDESVQTWNFGVTDEGVDVCLHGDTASTNAMWDASGNSLVFTGATTIVGQRAPVVTDATATPTLTAAQSGSIILCTYDGAVTLNLPAAETGLEYTIVRLVSATAITITPNGAERIAPDGANYETLAAVGDSAIVKCTGNATNEWIVIPGKLT